MRNRHAAPGGRGALLPGGLGAEQTALGALGICERAYQAARAYAQLRIQGRPHGHDTASPIVHHADVRRNLMTMRSQIEAMRALCYLTAATFDRANHLPDEARRREARALADLLTPIAKSWCTDVGNEVTSLAIQIFGGAGFVEESGVAQHYRDIRIMSIFEGSNGIQAQDLVGRKLPRNGGETVRQLLEEMSALASTLRAGDQSIRPIGSSLQTGVAALQRATAWMRAQGHGLPLPAAAGATAYQRLFGGVLAAHLLARGARSAHGLLQEPGRGGFSAEFLQAKVATARFFCAHLLPLACALEASATAGEHEVFGVGVGEL